jgi:hypothetical protein
MRLAEGRGRRRGRSGRRSAPLEGRRGRRAGTPRSYIAPSEALLSIAAWHAVRPGRPPRPPRGVGPANRTGGEVVTPDGHEQLRALVSYTLVHGPNVDAIRGVQPLIGSVAGSTCQSGFPVPHHMRRKTNDVVTGGVSRSCMIVRLLGAGYAVRFRITPRTRTVRKQTRPSHHSSPRGSITSASGTL